MTISLKYNLLFVHIPKNAGTSFRQAMTLADRNFLLFPHLMIKEYHTFLHSKFFENTFKFAIVRNPWDRVVSLYHYQMSETFRLAEPDRHAIAMSMNFREFVNYATFLQQLPWISLNGEVAVDYVGRFENLSETMQSLSEKSGLPLLELSYANSTSHDPYQSYYDNYTKNIIARKCEEDIDTFKYTFDSATLAPQLPLL